MRCLLGSTVRTSKVIHKQVEKARLSHHRISRFTRPHFVYHTTEHPSFTPPWLSVYFVWNPHIPYILGVNPAFDFNLTSKHFHKGSVVYRTTFARHSRLFHRFSSIAPPELVYHATKKSSITPPMFRLSHHPTARKASVYAGFPIRNTRARF